MKADRRVTKQLLRFAPALVLAVAAGATALLANSRGVAAPGLDELTTPGTFESMADAEERRAALNDRLELLQTRIRMKESLVAGLAAGHLSLPEVVECFRGLEHEEGGFWVQLRTSYPEATDEERLYRNVIAFTAATLHGRPERDDVVGRLEGELTKYLAQAHGAA